MMMISVESVGDCVRWFLAPCAADVVAAAAAAGGVAAAAVGGRNTA